MTSLWRRSTGWAERLANGPTVAINLTKRAVYQALRSDLMSSLNEITGHMGIAASTEDHIEASKAFVEKRQPEFKGR